MDKNKYFREALSDMTFDIAYGDSIRHLYNSGYSPEEIKAYLSSESLTLERIREVISKHRENTDEDSGNYEYVKEYDEFGRSYFVKKKTSADRTDQ